MNRLTLHNLCTYLKYVEQNCFIYNNSMHVYTDIVLSRWPVYVFQFLHAGFLCSTKKSFRINRQDESILKYNSFNIYKFSSGQATSFLLQRISTVLVSCILIGKSFEGNIFQSTCGKRGMNYVLHEIYAYISSTLIAD